MIFKKEFPSKIPQFTGVGGYLYEIMTLDMFIKRFKTIPD
jgi:hypothetical protein